MSLVDIRNNINLRKLNGKNEDFGVSSNLLNVRINEFSSININKLIRTAEDKKEFDKLVTHQLFTHLDINNYYDFSLLVGLNFGVYNSYGYQDLSIEGKESILRSNPNRSDTKYILDGFKKDLDILFKNKYNISSEDLKSIFDNMLYVTDREIFNSTIFVDIAKAIMGVKMKYSSYDVEMKSVNKNEVSNFIRSGRCIDYFNNLNEQNYSNIRK